jgi:hypothetical protein
VRAAGARQRDDRHRDVVLLDVRVESRAGVSAEGLASVVVAHGEAVVAIRKTAGKRPRTNSVFDLILPCCCIESAFSSRNCAPGAALRGAGQFA